jgi:hypothetical protein
MRLLDDNKLEELEERLKERGVLDKQGEAFWGEGILAGPANSGNRPMIELLRRCGARVPDISKWGRYYYFKHTEIAAVLLDNGMNPNHMNWHHVTLLHDMAQAGDITKARLLLDHGAEIDAVDEEYRSTPLGFAARWGKREMAALLLERGADPNKSGRRGPHRWRGRRKRGTRNSRPIFGAQAPNDRRSASPPFRLTLPSLQPLCRRAVCQLPALFPAYRATRSAGWPPVRLAQRPAVA